MTPTTGRRILLCEDEGLTALQLRKILQRAGYTVSMTASSQEAIALAEEEQPDLILMDIDLDGPGSGLRFTDTILQTRWVPVLMVTGYNDPDHLEAAWEAGAFGYLTKPFHGEGLVEFLETALARNEQMQAVYAVAEVFKAGQAVIAAPAEPSG